PPGRYEVVLEPTAVVDLLDNLAAWGFNGKALNEGRSFVELGTMQFDGSISIVDDPFDPRRPSDGFDSEGTAKRKLAFVDAGVTAAVAYDRRSAAQAGTVSTGHALPGMAAFGAVPLHLHLLAAGGVEVKPEPLSAEELGPMADSTVAALVGQVGRGLLVTD